MDITKLEARVNAANKRLNKAAELAELFDLLEKKFMEQEGTIDAISGLLESMLVNVENASILDDASQRMGTIVDGQQKIETTVAPRLIENREEPKEAERPRPAAESSPWAEADKG
jgi:hypothetical protein